MNRKDPRRYQLLLRVRKTEEGLRAQDFAQALRQTRNLERQQSELDLYQRQVLDRAGTEAAGCFVPGRVRALYQFERHLSRLADRKDIELSNQRNVTETRRAELNDAVKKRRIMERLIENVDRKRNYWLNRLEQRLHDEHSTIRFARTRLARHDI